MKNAKELIGNAQLTITYLRHSIKGPDGNLSEEGITKASDLDIHIRSNSNVKIYTSDIQRSIDTGKIIGRKFKISDPTIAPILSEFPYTDEKIEELGLSGGKWLLVESASKLLAAKIAKFTLDILESKTPNKNDHVIAISHVPPIMAFLGHVLAHSAGKRTIDEEIKAKLFESFDGFVKPPEGFEIIYDQNSKDFISVIFAKDNVQVPISFLQTFTNRSGSPSTD